MFLVRATTTSRPLDLTLEMGVGVVFAGAVVLVGGGGCVRGQFLEPDFVVVVEPGLVIVNEDRSSNMHGVD